MADMPTWKSLSLDSWLEHRPSGIAQAPVIGKLELLPVDQLTWEDFERLQWRVLRDVEGLRRAQLYGERGQTQKGLDVVALSPDRAGVALQSKRYKKFGPSELRAAVSKFMDTDRPFEVTRLIVGVSREVKSTKVVDELYRLSLNLHPIQLDLWGKRELSELLRKAPEIVVAFFGLPTAEAFCMPFTSAPITIPPANVVAIREALARTPEVATGARQLLDRANLTQASDPSDALSLVEEAQTNLRDAGFPGHAASHEHLRSQLLATLEREEEAGRTALNEVWTALDRGRISTAQLSQQRLRELSRRVVADRPVKRAMQELVEVAETATRLYLNPLAQVPPLESLQLGDLPDQARLLLLAGETALAADHRDWLSSVKADIGSAVTALRGHDEPLETRLRLLLAEATDEWSELLKDARQLRLGHALGALVSARYARRSAIRQEFEEADTLWDEAVGDACLAQCWEEASAWVFSRRVFRTRWRPFTSDELLPMQLALSEMGSSQRLLPVDEDAYQDSLQSLQYGKLRPAAISAQRALRDAVSTGDWASEMQARRLLGVILERSDEPELAAHHLTRAGDTAAVKELAQGFPRRFIDVRDDLQASNYWTVGTAYQVIGSQADLVPDDAVKDIANRIMDEVSGSVSGTLVDLPGFAASRYLGALKALGGLSDRLTPEQADQALSHFENQPPVDANHYRLHDDDEASAVAGIGLTHGQLRDRALAHLVPLLARSQSARNSTTTRLLDRHFDSARSLLQESANAGDSWARELLAFHDPRSTPEDSAADALRRLTTSLKHKAGVFEMGTSAVEDSLLVRGQPSDTLKPAMAELLQRADDPHVGSGDRGSYLLAASNLAPELDPPTRNSYFFKALECARDPRPSQQDTAEQQFKHRLGAFRIGQFSDSRAKATYLAAGLATTPEQRAHVRSVAFTLLGTDKGSDYWVTRALQQLDDALNEDVGFLCGQGWALRSLAAIIWTRHGLPPHVGPSLANDPEPSVRKALARALAESTTPETFQEPVRRILSEDPCYSVRAALGEAL